jgi:hypothetical protein
MYTWFSTAKAQIYKYFLRVSRETVNDIYNKDKNWRSE